MSNGAEAAAEARRQNTRRRCRVVRVAINAWKTPEEEGRLSEQIKRTLGPAMRRARMRAGLAQEIAADRIGIDSFYYARLEQGRGLPSLRTLAEIVQQLDVAAEELLGVEPPQVRRRRRTASDTPELRRLERDLRAASPKGLALVRELLDCLEGQSPKGAAERRTIRVPGGDGEGGA